MPYLPGATPAATPPEEEYVEPVAPVAAEAPPPATEEAIYGPAPTPEATPQEATPAVAPATEEAIYGPFSTAVKGVQGAVGEAVAPVAAALPEPVRNVADALGQPVGGAIDAVTNVTAALGQGDLPGAALAALQPAVEPWRRGVEAVGGRVAGGQPAQPTVGEVIEDPGQALAILPAIATTYGPAPAVSGVTLEDWAEANPQSAQDAYAAGGGEAVREAWLDSIGASDVPPPQLSNPLDAGAIDAGPLERGLAVAGAVPDFLGGWATAGREGALGPFALGQLQALTEDPLSLIPPAAGAGVSRGIGRAARSGLNRIPGGDTLLDLSPSEQARLRAEQVGTAAGEYVPALRTTDDLGAAPAATLTPGAIPTPSPNGPLAATPNLGQAVAAAPPIPEPGTLFHGSPTPGLTRLSADIEQAARRTADNPASAMGVFLSPQRALAEGYAGRAGTVYEAAPLRNPHRMDWEAFYARFANDAGGEVAGDAAVARALAFRDELRRRGHDGIYLTSPAAPPDPALPRALRDVMEVVSFTDVRIPAGPLRPRSADTGRPIIAPGTRPEIELPLRAQLDSIGLRDVGVLLVNDLRDAAPDARPSEGARYLPEQNAVAVALDVARLDELPALVEREAQKAVREQSLRQTAQAAYGAAPVAARQAVAEVPSPQLTRHGVVVSEPAARDLAQSADGLFRFADGYRPRGAATAEDVLRQTLDDVEFWANADDVTNRRWIELDKRLNPDGTVDRAAMRGPAGDPTTQPLRDAHAFAVYEDALQRALPRNAPQGRLGRLNQQYLGTVRRLMLFNPLRIPSYTLQNLITNSINLSARIGPKAVFDLFSKPSEMGKVFRNARSIGEKKPTYHTTFGSMVAKMKAGTKPNIPMSHAAYFDRLGGATPRWLETVQRALAPNTTRYIGTMADQLPREVAATVTIQRQYRKLNRELTPKVYDELRVRNVRVPKEKVHQVVRDFLDAERTITDLNTGAPIRTMLGMREAKFEPIWAADDLGAYLKRHLTEDMRHTPDPGDLGRAIDRIVRDSKNRVRGILDSADQAADDALFPWRNTNADEMAGRLFLYHYWTSRQGGLYVTEALKRPYLISAYGRMMDEFEQQAEELDQPPWMKGFFQMQNSVAGFSTWFSPFDLVQSLLTFADWQYGADDNAKYKDITALGKGAGMAPFLIHPALQMVAYSLGLLGPDYYAPPLTGAETYGAKAIDLLNLANAQGVLPAWVNAAGIGVDANGNKVPVPVRPLQELYARIGNAVSTAFAPITGLSPVEVANMGGSWERNVASIVETEYRKAHPEADQMDVNRAVTDILADASSPEYQAAFRKAADMPFQLTAGLPGIVQGAARIASPVRVYNWPEQYNLDRWNVSPSGYAPERNIPGLEEGSSEAAAERAKFVLNAAKYGATTTPEGRELANKQNEYYALEPLDYAEANDVAQDIYYQNLTEPVTVGGVEYTPEQLAALSDDDRYALGTQALADAGYSRDDQQGIRDAQARYLADNPDFAAYQAYKDLVGYTEEEQKAFVDQTAMVNPGFRQFVRSSLMDHTTGEIAYGDAGYIDAYLASQGRRPSVYSPLVGNEPSTIPGGYPELAGLESGQPLLPPVTGTEPFPLYSRPVDPDSYYANEDLIAWIDPALAGRMQTVSGADPRYGMVQVSVGDAVGFVDPAYLQSAAPPQPTAVPGPAPTAIQPTGGLAGLAGGAAGAVGGAVTSVLDAAGAVVGSMTGTPDTPGTKPADTSAGVAPGAYDVVPASDGIGEQSTRDGSDRSWLEYMFGNDAYVHIDYKQPVTWNVDYSYQVDHGAAGNVHAAFDVGCESGPCAGKPLVSPVAGRVVCAGYGQGTGEAIGSPACTYSANTTAPGSAHTVVVEVGRDENGNPIQLAFNHVGDANLTPGQVINVGDPIGTVGNTDGGPHIHIEGWLGDPASGYTIVDPQLIVSGYYGPVGSYATQGGEVITP